MKQTNIGGVVFALVFVILIFLFCFSWKGLNKSKRDSRKNEKGIGDIRNNADLVSWQKHNLIQQRELLLAPLISLNRGMHAKTMAASAFLAIVDIIVWICH